MPARYPRVRRRLKQLGVRLTERAGKGSHVVVDNGKGRIYTLPLHHGEQTELSDVYLRGLCRAMLIDYQTFKKGL